MISLDNKLHHEELNRVILRVMRMADLDIAIKKIENARKFGTSYSQQDENTLAEMLGNPVHTNQPTARVAYWYSFAGWGGLIIERNADSEGFRHLNVDMLNITQEAIKNPPGFYQAKDETDWERYYIGDLTTQVSSSEAKIESDLSNLLTHLINGLESANLRFSKNILARFLASCLTKRLILLTGLSGSGKTKLAQAFAMWITGKVGTDNDPFKTGSEIKSDRISYHVSSSDSISIEFLNAENEEEATKVLLPRSLIKEWAEVIRDNDFTRETPARTIREMVGKKTSFSTQLNSFETHLKAAAFALIESANQNVGEKGYEVVAVGADWDNSENLLGYPDMLRLKEKSYVKPSNGILDLILRARFNPNLPFFLILDEMNLSHVERYFADFLSAMESGEPINLHEGSERDLWGENHEVPGKLHLPENLFIIGTVNIDETTYLFSPKVLDRANVIEFRVDTDQMEKFLSSPGGLSLELLKGKGSAFGRSFVSAAKLGNVAIEKIARHTESDSMRILSEDETPLDVEEPVSIKLRKDLSEVFNVLAKVGAEFGYRTVFEMSRFIYYYTLIYGKEARYLDAFDVQLMQKLLPKLNGSIRKLGPVLESLQEVCAKHDLRISLEKIQRMSRNLDQNGFTSYAEA
jgi:energy-coupling factor transporter ATP-binding protein EcfA2